MGDRISIQFIKGQEKSVTLFSHWGGIGFLKYAQTYANQLMEETEGKHCYPLERLEPNTVMMDFIRLLTKNLNQVNSDYYLGATPSDGDNSDNGHHLIHLYKGGINEQTL